MIDTMNKWYKWDDGWFEYYINTNTGEKKLQLEEGDIEVNPNVDDFYEKRSKLNGQTDRNI